MKAWLSIVIAAMTLSFAIAPVSAYMPDEVLKDPKLETRARALSLELRCLVCQNQSIDDSDAPLARDLRILLRERLTAGDSDSEVIDFIVARYGEFVLLRPRFNTKTLVLWLGPLFILLLGGWAVFTFLRRGKQDLPEETAMPLSDDESRRVEQLLGDGEGRKST